MPITLQPLTAVATRLGASVRDARFVSTREIWMHVVPPSDAFRFMQDFRDSLLGGTVWFAAGLRGVLIGDRRDCLLVRVDCDFPGTLPEVRDLEPELVAAHAATWEGDCDE